MDIDSRYAISELSALAGVSRRTIRYYVQRGLIPPPLGAGRGHYYTADHLNRLLAVKVLQERGFSLDEIERQLAGGEVAAHIVEASAPPPAPMAPPSASPAPPAAAYSCREASGDRVAGPPPALPDVRPWLRVEVAEGIELHIEGSRHRLPPERVQLLRQAVRDIIAKPFPSDRDTERGDSGNDQA